MAECSPFSAVQDPIFASIEVSVIFIAYGWEKDVAEIVISEWDSPDFLFEKKLSRRPKGRIRWT